MSGAEVDQRCVQLLPLPGGVSRSGWSQFRARHHSSCDGLNVDLDWFVTHTVPCPPPQNPCVFWEAAEKTNLSDTVLSLVTQTCAIPDHYQCSQLGDAVPSSRLTEGCDSVCATLVGLFVFAFFIITVGAFILWKRKNEKTYKELCSGVCICFDKVFINKRGLNRTESRSPTLESEGGSKEVNSDKKRCNGYINGGVTMDYIVERVEFKRPMGDDISDAGDYETLREDADLQRCSYPAPDLTMVTKFQRDDEKRLSDC